MGRKIEGDLLVTHVQSGNLTTTFKLRMAKFNARIFICILFGTALLRNSVISELRANALTLKCTIILTVFT